MGLDMYLTMGAGDERQTIFQWRKANQLRAWFVRRASLNPNEEVEVVLDKADIIQLRNDIQSVLLNPKRAPYICQHKPVFSLVLPTMTTTISKPSRARTTY